MLVLDMIVTRSIGLFPVDAPAAVMRGNADKADRSRRCWFQLIFLKIKSNDNIPGHDW